MPQSPDDYDEDSPNEDHDEKTELLVDFGKHAENSTQDSNGGSEKKKKKKEGHGHSHSHSHSHSPKEGKKKHDHKRDKHDHDHDKHDDHDHDHDHKDHDHDHDHDHDEEKEEKKQKKEAAKATTSRARKALIGATTFTVIFMIIEIAGGYIAGSLAIMTDAAHLLTDVAAMLLSLFAMHLAGRPANKTHSFGYHRAEILGALTSIVTIWALVAILVYEAILRLYNDSRLVGDEVDGRIMTIIGVCGFFVNIIDAGILHWGKAPHGHSHSHGHSHGHGHGDVNVRAAFIHVLGDCLQSVGVIVAALIIWIGNQVQFGSPRAAKSFWNLADPIASLIFSVITLFTTVQLSRKMVSVLMEKVPEEIDYDEVEEEMSLIPGVNDVHDLHIWSLSVGKVSLSVHLAADEHSSVLSAAQQVCRNHGISHVTIQVDPISKTKECESHNLH